jgi:hypothetical protein
VMLQSRVSFSSLCLFPMSDSASLLLPNCPSNSVGNRKPADPSQKKRQLTHVMPAAFHANVILAVWQDGDWVALFCWVRSRVWQEKARAAEKLRPAPRHVIQELDPQLLR